MGAMPDIADPRKNKRHTGGSWLRRDKKHLSSECELFHIYTYNSQLVGQVVLIHFL